MKLLLEGIGEFDPNLQWMIMMHLRILEEVAREPRGSGTGELTCKKHNGAWAMPWSGGLEG